MTRFAFQYLTRRLVCVVLAAAVGLGGLAPAAVQAQGRESQRTFLKTNPSFLAAFRPVVAKTRQSTVQIRCDGEYVALGTIVGSDGLILTKASTLSGTPVVLLTNGKEYEAQIIAQKDEHDLALLKIEATDLTPVDFHSSRTVPVGSWAVSVGTGRDPVTVGVVSVGSRNLTAKHSPSRSHSGGYLGIALDPANAGARITEVLPRSGAADAGLRPNDTILAVAGKAISDVPSLIRTLQNYKSGDTVLVRVRRGDRELEVRATLGPRPSTRGDIQNRMGSKLSDRIDGFSTVLQHDSVVDPEQCGGPLVNLEGKVIGINISRAGRTESYAIPTEVILPLIQEMRNSHPVPSSLIHSSNGSASTAK